MEVFCIKCKNYKCKTAYGFFVAAVCSAYFTIDYVTGKKKYIECCKINTKGKCLKFERKEQK